MRRACPPELDTIEPRPQLSKATEDPFAALNPECGLALEVPDEDEVVIPRPEIADPELKGDLKPGREGCQLGDSRGSDGAEGDRPGRE